MFSALLSQVLIFFSILSTASGNGCPSLCLQAKLSGWTIKGQGGSVKGKRKKGEPKPAFFNLITGPVRDEGFPESKS